MNYIYTARELIKEAEGLRLKSYKCPAGFWTIGYGHNLDAKPLYKGMTEEQKQNLTITEMQAERILDNDIDYVVKELENESFYIACNGDRKAVLIDMAFNIGIAGLKKFKRMIEALDRGDFEKASKEYKLACDKMNTSDGTMFGIGSTLKGLKEIQEAREDYDTKKYEDASKEAQDSKWYAQVKSRGKRNVEILKTGELV